jgi:endoglucanase
MEQGVTTMTASAGRPPPKASRRSRVLRVLAALVALAALQLGLGPIKATPASAAVGFSGPPVVRVSGNKLVDGGGNPIRLIGVDHSGSESACVDGEGFFDPPNSDTPGMIAAMKSWNINTVRLPLNEDCWLGINLPFPLLGGSAYRSALFNYVNDLNAAGLAVILDLHWNAPGSQTAVSGTTMADEDHAPTFWGSVASTFKGHQGVVFDLYNEPRYLHWSCLVNGGCVIKGMQVAGYNQLISDVRATGATNVVMVAGTAFAANPTGFRKSLPTDPIGQLAISVHVYNFNAAKKPASWNKWVHIGLLSKVPVVTGELGEKDCTPNFINTYMTWADANGVSYLAWAFNAGPSWACNAPSLITDYSGNPTPYGAGYKAHLATL